MHSTGVSRRVSPSGRTDARTVAGRGCGGGRGGGRPAVDERARERETRRRQQPAAVEAEAVFRLVVVAGPVVATATAVCPAERRIRPSVRPLQP